MKKALIIVDMQNDYFSGGNMELVSIDDALENTLKLIKYAQLQDFEIFFIQHIATRTDATFFLPDTQGVELHKHLKTHLGTIVTKHFPNSFRQTSLQRHLQNRKIKDIIICGAMSHMCIDATIRAGFDLGYNIELVHDACATKDLIFKNNSIKAKDVHDTFMASLNGTFCTVKSTQDILRTFKHIQNFK